MTENWLEQIHSHLTEIRKDLHANYPELSEHEYKTCERITNYLKEHTSLQIQRVGNTGVLATFEGKEAGKTVLLRGDIDALPIQETNDFLYASKKTGISHMCGHDGHSTILIGVALALEKFPLKKGRILLLWQPAEENGMGAKSVIANPLFKHLKVDFAFALHNLPGIPKHEIILKHGSFTSHVKSMIIRLQGKTAHAAEPEHGNNPSMAIANIIRHCEKLTYNKPETTDFFLITPVYTRIGSTSYGISAGEGELHLTIRSWSPELFDKKCSLLTTFIETCCREEQLEAEISWTQEFHANQNNEEAVKFLENALQKTGDNYSYRLYPFKWGEDFGLFTERFKGAMFGVGAGIDTPALHNPDYDFPDEIIPTSIRVFYTTLQEIQN